MKCTDQPLISVIMGVRHPEEDVSALVCSVESILQQTYQNLELLICEDASSRQAKDVLCRYAQSDGRICLIDGKAAETLAEKLNRCLKAAKGTFIARQDDDDVSAPERLERQIGFLLSHAEISFVGCNVELMQGGAFAGMRTFPEYPTPRDFLFVQPFIHPTLLFRKEALETVGGYCAEKRCDGCEDYDLLLRLYAAGMAGANLQKAYFQYSIPLPGQSKRTLSMRIRESRVRWARFQQLGMLPGALPYVIKPVLVGLLPNRLLAVLKRRVYGHI